MFYFPKLFIVFFFLSNLLFAQTEDKIVIIKNENLIAKVNSYGAQLQNLLNNKNGQEYIWQRNPEYWKQSSPVLFPFVGKLWEEGYFYNEKKYKMTNHGFASQSLFKIVYQKENEVWFSLQDNDNIFASYPFHFVFKVGYILEGKTLKVVYEIQNKGNSAMPFQVGGHPGIQLPDVLSNDNIKGFLSFKTTQDPIHYIVKEKNNFFLNSPAQHTLILENGLLPITRQLFKDDSIVFENYQARSVTVYDKNKTPIVSVDFDMPVFALWSIGNKNAPFICIEPWWGRGDKENYKGDVRNRDWTNNLAPNETFVTSYSIHSEN